MTSTLLPGAPPSAAAPAAVDLPPWHPRALGGPPDPGDPEAGSQPTRGAARGVLLDGLTAAEIAAAPDRHPLLVERTPIAQAAEAALVVQGRRRGPLPRPPRTRVLVVANQKGGVGKTTSAVNLAAGLAAHGLRVLVVDLDPQGNASTALGVDRRPASQPTSSGPDGASSYEVLVDDLPLRDAEVPVDHFPTLSCVPSSLALAGAEIELVGLAGREYRLRDALRRHLDGPGSDLDYVLVDCPPSLGLLTLNALVAGEEALVPIQCEYYALEGVTQLVHTIDLVSSHLNPALRISTVLLTMYDARTRLSAQVAAEVRGFFAAQVLRTAIPRSVRISEAPGFQQTVLTYDPGSSGALSYLAAARELAERVEVA